MMMLCFMQNRQIGIRIVGVVPINVVYMFRALKLSAQLSFHVFASLLSAGSPMFTFRGRLS